MGLNKVEICNFALAKLGATRIGSLTDSSEEARQCNIFYDQTVREILREYPWSFATEAVQLAQSTTTPLLDFKYQYALPDDYMRVWRMNDGTERYDIRGNYIHTDASSCKILYTKEITDPTLFDPLAVRALYTLLASKIAYPLQQESAREGRLLEEYYAVVGPLAKSIDSMESDIPRDIQSDWINSRY
jgi:hypothetical protein